MELTISDEKMRDVLKDILIELMQEKRELFHDVLVEALEDVGLGNAIAEGRRDDFVDEDSISAILEGAGESSL